MESSNKDNEFKELMMQWTEEQKKLAPCVQCSNAHIDDDLANNRIQYVGGLDISYPVSDPFLACGCCVVYDLQKKKVVYKDIIEKRISVPYIPGYLAYHEMDVYRILLDKLRLTSYWPSVFLVDGQGQLHPRHVGTACIVGLEYNCPSIGVAKNPFCGSLFGIPSESHCSGKNSLDVCDTTAIWKQTITNGLNETREFPILHNGEMIGMALCPPDHTKPIYISVGNCISLRQAVQIVSSLCVYRIPEPIRYADHLSREYLRSKKDIQKGF